MEVLDRSDLVDIISWMPHGRAFIVKKPKLFAVDVLPRFFKQTKYLSFTRQLNLWGFKRITKGLDGGAYVSIGDACVSICRFANRVHIGSRPSI
jgi:hypothetical protein